MTNQDYPPLATCLRTLEILVRDGDPNKIGLAEKAIDEFLNHDADLNRRTGHLNILNQELEHVWKGADGKSLEFVNLLTDYIAKKFQELRHD